MSAVKPNRWAYLVSETQFATELVVTGLRRLCTVPDANEWFSSYDQIYPLHVGLHSYTSGLERLCKLTIACHGFVTSGTFPRLKSFSHRILTLLDRVDSLNIAGLSSIQLSPMKRPISQLDPDLTKFLQKFANGTGRYEHLDSLSGDGPTVSTFDTWSSLSNRCSVSKRLMDLVSMREAVNEAMKAIWVHADFEASGFSTRGEIDDHFSEKSIALAMEMYNKASWVASSLDAVTYYTGKGLPILNEAMVAIQQPQVDFFQFSIARIADAEVTSEELKAHHLHYKDYYDYGSQ